MKLWKQLGQNKLDKKIMYMNLMKNVLIKTIIFKWKGKN